ncbi:OmpA family protein [Rickettsiales bacterium Ac37b]|nr:OmpA family protein [Rickettsiales bacterium Ac37b]
MKKLLLNVVLYTYFMVSIFNAAWAFEYKDMGYNKPDVELHLEVLNQDSPLYRKDMAFPIVCKDQVYDKIENRKYEKNKHHNNMEKYVAKDIKYGTVLPKAKQSVPKPTEDLHTESVAQSKQDEKVLPMTIVTPVEVVSEQGKKTQDLPKTEIQNSPVVPNIVKPVMLPENNNSVQPQSNSKMLVKDSENKQNVLPQNGQINENSSIKPVSPVIPTPPVPPAPPVVPPIPVPSDLPKKTLLENQSMPKEESAVDQGDKIYNINFDGGTKLLKDVEKKLNIIARDLHDDNSKILKIIGYIKAEKEQDAETRSASLKRVISIRNYLVDQGISSTRLMVQAGILSSGSNTFEVEIQEMDKAKLD